VITGPEEGTAAGRGHLRAAHADREHVIDLLKAAFVQDRLTKDALDARTGQALTARTYAELGALTADIPAAPPAARPPRQPARPQNRPKQAHLVRNAAIGSVSCLTVAAAAFCYGASLDDHYTGWFLFLTLFALLAVPCIIARAVATSVGQRRSRRQLPPRPGQGGQAPAARRHSSIGHDSSRPGARIDQSRADLRAHRSRPDRPRPRGRGVPVPHGARPAPGIA
jgi:Domain of unknown function (DUF1707)